MDFTAQVICYLQQASDCYSRVLAAKPDHVPTISNVAMIARDLGKPEIAASLLSEALVQAPENLDVLYNLAVIHFSCDEVDRAIHYGSTGAEQSPSCPHRLLQTGRQY